MSNQVNTDLLERAAICVDYFEGKLPAKLIEQDIDAHDYDSLVTHVKQAENVMFELEYDPISVDLEIY